MNLNLVLGDTLIFVFNLDYLALTSTVLALLLLAFSLRNRPQHHSKVIRAYLPLALVFVAGSPQVILLAGAVGLLFNHKEWLFLVSGVMLSTVFGNTLLPFGEIANTLPLVISVSMLLGYSLAYHYGGLNRIPYLCASLSLLARLDQFRYVPLGMLLGALCVVLFHFPVGKSILRRLMFIPGSLHRFEFLVSRTALPKLPTRTKQQVRRG
ncbi:MAG: hypothetical protein PHV61_07685 [Limnochordia bacterium]|nr:hypothetical protein [Limnochordia bacterium]MDD2630019.1 hypothetical protein [Limnochordia bacterium]MDD4517860.1 hypothetical protein [Limnochordia bacterium]